MEFKWAKIGFQLIDSIIHEILPQEESILLLHAILAIQKADRNFQQVHPPTYTLNNEAYFGNLYKNQFNIEQQITFRNGHTLLTFALSIVLH